MKDGSLLLSVKKGRKTK